LVAFLGTLLTVVAVTPAAATTSVPVQRIYGADAIGTSIAVSQAEFPTNDSARAVVLARSDFFADALAGGPLAAQLGGPLLITPGAGISSAIDPRVEAEIQRVLPVGATVYILGGDLALSANIDTALQALGFVTQRIAGADEYATAVDIAEALGNPTTIFEATGLTFQDALSAVPAAIKEQGAILLTDGATQAPETAAYLATYPADTRYAIGGSFAAYGADPTATPVYGQDLYGTSAAVATTFFASATAFGAATGADFPDALSGGVLMGEPGTAGPMVLVAPSGPLPTAIDTYLSGVAPTLTQGFLFGGALAVGDDVLAQLENPQVAPLSITSGALPSATNGTPYSATLTVTGGTAPYTWSIVAGATPQGLNLSSSGVINGTPTSVGSSTFTVQVTDSTAPLAFTATQTYSIEVAIPVLGSSNWSGYYVGNGPFTQVSGTFSVTSLDAAATSDDEMAEWVGIGGVASGDNLIQAGIVEYLDPTNPNLFYIQPAFEIVPADPEPIAITSVAVAPGDQVTVAIQQITGTSWGITLTDDTNGESFTTDQTYTGPGVTAEWIVEAPGTGDLAAFDPVVDFSDLSASPASTTVSEVIMVQAAGQVSTPSSLDANGFNVAYGDVAPAAP
jgi:hypothetical protein